MKWLVLVDIDNTLARSSLGIHPGDRTAWARELARPIRAIPLAVQTLPTVAELADVAIVSGRPDHVEPQTCRWLRRRFPDISYQLHLCPVGTDPKAFKAGVYRDYRRSYAGRICAIDDVRYDGPRHFFTAPRGWPALLVFLQAVSDEAGEPVADGLEAGEPVASTADDPAEQAADEVPHG